MSTTETTTSYDALPYPSYTFPATHLARLAAIGRIFGLETAEPRTARVLELGCGTGINLVAQSQLFPEAEFVGIDASKKQIETGRDAAGAAGTDRVRLICADIAKVEEDLGQFDYIITHGIYSWVPTHVKEAILRISRDNLKPSGIAYVSYNCLPGWRMRGALRDMMIMHTGGLTDINAKVAQGKALIKFLAESCAEDTPYGKYLRQELEMLKNVDDSYIAHEFLEDDNNALYFVDFLKEAAKFNLTYLGDAEVATMLPENLPAQAAQTLKSLNLNLFATEQYMDFVRNRTFRTSLLCHPSATLNRNVDPSRIANLELGTLIGIKQPWKDGKATFVALNGNELNIPDQTTAKILEGVAKLGTNSKPVAQFLDETLAEVGDKISGSDDAAKRNNLSTILLQCYFRKLVDLLAGPYSLRRSQAAHPETLPLARWQAQRGLRVSSQRLDMLTADAFVAKFITINDGTRDAAAAVEALLEAVNKKELQINENNQPVADPARVKLIVEQLYPRSLANLERLGLIVPKG